MKKDTFLFKKTGKANSAVEYILSADYNKQGKFACLQNISAKDVTTAPTQIDLGIMRGSDFIPLKSILAPAADFTVTRETEIWTYIDDMPAVRVLGAVVGDEIELIIGGYILYAENGG